MEWEEACVETLSVSFSSNSCTHTHTHGGFALDVHLQVLQALTTYSHILKKGYTLYTNYIFAEFDIKNQLNHETFRIGSRDYPGKFLISGDIQQVG